MYNFKRGDKVVDILDGQKGIVMRYASEDRDNYTYVQVRWENGDTTIIREMELVYDKH
jgi:hypothetical protein